MAEDARLVLFAPKEADAERLCAALQSALDVSPVDAVVLPVMGEDDRARINHAKTIAALVQPRGAALLLVDAYELVARVGADGVHLSTSANLSEVMAVLKPMDRIIGVGGLKARHDAMEVAEAGTDYVMFGEPRADGSILLSSAVLERVEWWAELFQTPCVAFASDLEMATPLAETGAEFVAFGAAVLDAPEGPAEAMRQAVERVKAARRPER